MNALFPLLELCGKESLSRCSLCRIVLLHQNGQLRPDFFGPESVWRKRGMAFKTLMEPIDSQIISREKSNQVYPESSHHCLVPAEVKVHTFCIPVRTLLHHPALTSFLLFILHVQFVRGSHFQAAQYGKGGKRPERYKFLEEQMGSSEPTWASGVCPDIPAELMYSKPTDCHGAACSAACHQHAVKAEAQPGLRS